MGYRIQCVAFIQRLDTFMGDIAHVMCDRRFTVIHQREVDKAKTGDNVIKIGSEEADQDVIVRKRPARVRSASRRPSRVMSTRERPSTKRSARRSAEKQMFLHFARSRAESGSRRFAPRRRRATEVAAAMVQLSRLPAPRRPA